MRVKGSHGSLDFSLGLMVGVICLPSSLGFGLGVWSLLLADGTDLVSFVLMGLVSIGVVIAAAWGSALFIKSYCLSYCRSYLGSSLPSSILTGVPSGLPESPDLQSNASGWRGESSDEGRFFSGNELLILDLKDSTKDESRGLQ